MDAELAVFAREFGGTGAEVGAVRVGVACAKVALVAGGACAQVA